MKNSTEQPNDSAFGTKSWSDLSTADQDRYILACISGQPYSTMLSLELIRWQATALVKRFGLPETPCEGVTELSRREQFVRERLGGTQLGDRIQRAIDRRDGRLVVGEEPDPFDIKLPEGNLSIDKAPSPPVDASVEMSPQSLPAQRISGWGCLSWVPFLVLPVSMTLWGIDAGYLGSGRSIVMALFRFLLLALLAFILAIGASEPLRARGVPGPARWILIYILYTAIFFIAALLAGLEGAYPDHSLPSRTRP